MKYHIFNLLALLGIVLAGCKKPEQETLTPKITNDKVETTATTATFTWTVDWPGKLISVVEVSENEDMSHSQIYGSETETENHNFTVTVPDLKVATKYYYRYLVWNHHYVDNKFEFEVKNFSTQTDLPKVKTLEAIDITRTSAVGQGEILSDGGLAITERGICWGTNHNPATSGNHAASSQNTSVFSVQMSNLTPGETYYVRAYAKNDKGTGYSEDEVWFYTGDAVVPTVTTVQVTDISWRTATGGGEVTDDGDAMVTERGVCWSISDDPTIDDNHISNGSGSGTFVAEMTDLTAGTTYHVRAYAKNRAGYGYGNDVSFKTADAILPTVSTADPMDITRTKVTCGGEVTSDGGSDVTERGVCWSTNPNPSISGSHLADAGNGMGSFSVQIIGLTPNTSYYVCSYAINSVGISFGTPKSFATMPLGKPTVTTTQVTNITQTSATGGGNVTDDGGAEVTERGVCWSTEHNPTLENCQGNAHSGTGTGSFSLNLTGLTHGTKYYVSAFATNSEGTSYGGEISFTTLTQYYTINVSVSPSNSGTVTGGGEYQQGQSCTVTATANSGYGFTNWTENGNVVSSSASYEFTVTGNRTLVANFTPQFYTISVSANPSNGGGVSGGGTYNYGQSCIVTATAASGFGFVNWTENGNAVSSSASYAFTVTGSRTLVANFIEIPEGAINGLFTINENGDQVRFSQGNLQYNKITNEWSFMEHQYDIVETDGQDVGENYADQNIVSLFGWGTSGYNHNNACYQPWSTSGGFSNYYAYGRSYYNLNSQTGQADWGYNSIINGGNQENQWRTLTGGNDGEWKYVLQRRTTTTGIRYAKAQITGTSNGTVNGVILFPDDWSTSNYIPNNYNQSGVSFSSNSIPVSQWPSLEAAGAVFLPTAGYRAGGLSHWAGSQGSYNSATHEDSNNKYYMYFNDVNLNASDGTYRFYGHSVRLVCPAD